MPHFPTRERDREPEVRINHRIRVPEVRLVGIENEPLGIMRTDDARALATQHNVDLVEISPRAMPPVCRLIDWGKYKYLAKKKETQQKQAKVELKEITLHYKTGDHDIQRMIKQALGWLEEGHRVKFKLQLRGRENAFAALAKTKMEGISAEVCQHATPESPIRQEGRDITMTFYQKR